MSTVRALLNEGAARLGQDKRLEAEMLLASVLSCSRAHLLSMGPEEAAEDCAKAYRELVERRALEEPLQYLLGRADFMGMELVVTPDVLIPRFDTEILVEEAIGLLRGADVPKRALDVCTGSGAIAVSLAKYVPGLEQWASDLSPAAVAIARENCRIQQQTVHFCTGDLLAPFAPEQFGEYFSLIVSNPPYITTEELTELPGDVRREPTMALWGGDDGLNFYRRLTAESRGYLAREGYLAMEIGFAQGAAVRALLEEAGFVGVRVVKDWQAHDRVVLGQWPGRRD